MNKYDHVVIGSGVGGLTTALILGKFGKKVALLEQHSNTAPLIRRFKRNDFWCDPGFHYTGGLKQSGPLSILFRYLGLAEHIKALPMDANGFDVLSFKNSDKYKMPYGMENLKDFLCSRFPNSIQAVKAYIQKVIDINNSTAFMNPDVPFTEFSSEIYLNHSLESFLKSVGAEQKLIDLLGNHGFVLYGSPASDVPLHTHAYIMGSFYESASLIIDGGNSLINAFERELKKYDISVFTNCSVSGFNVENGKTLKGVYCEDERYFECDFCVSTIHPKLLLPMLRDASVRPVYINRIKKLENTLAAVVLFLEADDFPEEVLTTNYYEFDPDLVYDKQIDYTAYMAVNPQAETRGKRAFTVIKSISIDSFKPYFGNAYVDDYDKYLAIKEKAGENICSVVTNKFPTLKDNCKVLDISTPVTYQRYTKTVDGCMYGIKHSIAQRQLSTRSSVHNLYLAGQSIQAGVMGSVISGFIAALNIVDNNTLDREIRACH